MPKVRLYPHLVAGESGISFGSWWLEERGVWIPLEATIADWDYASEVTLGLSVVLRSEELLERTGQSSLEDLSIALIADCAASSRTIVSKHPLAAVREGNETLLPLRLPAGQLAEKTRLSAHLVLDAPSPTAKEGAARAKGARLASSQPQTVILEGTASRFPIDPVQFGALGYPDVPWILKSSFDDPRDNFMSTVRLWVNVDNTVGRTLLEPETTSSVGSAAKEYVVRTIVALLADPQFDEYLEAADFDEDSVGFVAGRICELYLGTALRVATQQYREDPVGFGVRVMEKLDPYKGMAQ